MNYSIDPGSLCHVYYDTMNIVNRSFVSNALKVLGSYLT